MRGNASGKTADGMPFSGYEMHMGVTQGPDCARPFAHLSNGSPEGAVSAEGRVIGTYIHGLFADDRQRSAWLQRLGEVPFERLVDPGNYIGTAPQMIDRLLARLSDIPEIRVNGHLQQRVPHNLNISFNYVEGESLIMGVKGLAVSSGSACTSASLEPSYVLRALGRSDELAHSSLRMTIGRWTTEEDIDFAVQTIRENVAKLRELSPLWEMYKDGIDLNTIQWAAH